ncbi:MAG: N-6 DNA methylase [bacterium]|nr:N-6 DNA methylase [bacterium]
MNLTTQLTLLGPHEGLLAAEHDGQSNHGEVFTRRWVVEFILDLIDYRPDNDLASRVIVEPACGTGAFLIPIVDRLVASCEIHNQDLVTADDAIRAFDVLEANTDLARKAVAHRLGEHGFADETAERLASEWVTTADFLLHDHRASSADFVVGNPPYIRLEDVPRSLTDAYRRACPTMQGRSDIYVGFLEAGLRLLKPNSVLGFICADRWMHNQYGGALRQLITSEYAVDTIVSMHDVDAFENEVSAYPAIVVLRNGEQESVNLIETRAAFDNGDAEAVRDWVQGEATTISRAAVEGAQLSSWFSGSPSWPGGNPVRQALVADLESRFPPLENADTGTRVGIGVATGCDDAYITTDADLVEADRLLPLLLARDTSSGLAEWSGQYLVNPWKGDGLVDLANYPRLQAYLDNNADRLKSRYVAKRRPHSWYRTIDKVDPILRTQDKLVLPDIKASANPVLDEGEYYPHHNLYFVVSEAWDLEVLGGLLLSDVANAIIGSYCVKMRGGYYRFQAQYIRRMRVPEPGGIDRATRRGLATAFGARDREAATAHAAKVFGIDRSVVRAALQS